MTNVSARRCNSLITLQLWRREALKVSWPRIQRNDSARSRPRISVHWPLSHRVSYFMKEARKKSNETLTSSAAKWPLSIILSPISMTFWKPSSRASISLRCSSILLNWASASTTSCTGSPDEMVRLMSMHHDTRSRIYRRHKRHSDKNIHLALERVMAGLVGMKAYAGVSPASRKFFILSQ